MISRFKLQGTSHSLHRLVRELLSDKKREDIPVVSDVLLVSKCKESEAAIGSCLVYHFHNILLDQSLPPKKKKLSSIVFGKE